MSAVYETWNFAKDFYFFSNFLALICPKKVVFKRKKVSRGTNNVHKYMAECTKTDPETTQQNPVEGQE